MPSSSSLLPQVVGVAHDDKAKHSPPPPTTTTATTKMCCDHSGSTHTTSTPSSSPPPPPSSLMLPRLLTSFTRRGGGGGNSGRGSRGSRGRRPMMVILSLLAGAVAVVCAARSRRGPLLRRRRDDSSAVVQKTTRANTAPEDGRGQAAAVPSSGGGDRGGVIDLEDGGSSWSPPPGYPWNDLLLRIDPSKKGGTGEGTGENDTTTKIPYRTTVDVGLLLSRYDDLASPGGGGRQNRNHHHRLDVSSDGRGSQSIPYLIKGGRLFCPESNLLDAQTFDWFGYWYRDRIRPFQEMVSEALRLGRGELVGRRGSGGHHPGFEKLVGSDVVLPLILDFADYRGCRRRRRGGDEGDANDDDEGAWPRFTFAKEAASPPALAGRGADDNVEGCGIPFAVPGYDTWLRHKNTKLSPSDWDTVFRNQEDRYPWKSKLPVAVWRGSTTGDDDATTEGATTWRDLPRARLVKFGMDNPHLLDAGFTKVLQRTGEEAKEIERESRVVARGMPFDEFMRYKVVVDIDGNSWSSRFGQLLCTNLVVLKVEPKYTEYFYSELVPWEHYVPVRADMSNLISTIEYAVSDDNEERMRGIVRNANDWCRSKMTRRRMALDMLWILVSYAELLDGSIIAGGGGGGGGRDNAGDGVTDGGGGGGNTWRERWEEWTSEQRVRTSSTSSSSSSTRMVPVGDPDASTGEWMNELPYVLVRSLFARITTTTMTRRRPSSSSGWLVPPLLLVTLVVIVLVRTMGGKWPSSFSFWGRQGTVPRSRSRHVHQS